jgi:CubicO group peptidase (beta-lactamase class C family)
MERAAGEEFLSFIRQRVTEPLGMIHTVADLKDTIISYRSGFYALDSGIVINAPYVDCSNKWAGGGYLSTSEDIVRMGNAMLYAELFPQNIVDTLLTSMQTDSGKVTGYGMGWSVDTDENGTFSFGHAGGSVGGSCRLIVYPDEKLVIAVLTNDSRTPIVRDLDKIAAVFLKN